MSSTQQVEQNKYVVNSALSSSLGVGWIPINQFFYWLVIWVFVFVAKAILVSLAQLQLSSHAAAFTSMMLCLAFWALTGGKEYQFFDRIRALTFLQPTWIRARIKIKWTLASLPTKEKVGVKGNTFKRLWDKNEPVLAAIEDYSDLVCYGQIEQAGYSVGFYLLEPIKGQYKFVFRWGASGIHPTITEETAINLLEQYWEKGVENFPPGEEITVEQSSFTEDSWRQAELDALLQGQDNELATALIYSQKALTRSLTKAGIRKTKKILISATYTPGRLAYEDRDLISRLLRVIEQYGRKVWEIFSGQKEELNHQRLQKLVASAFTNGFLSYHSLFTNTMGLTLQPLTAAQNWNEDYSVYHQEKAPALPQVLILDEHGLRIVVDEEHLHASTVLFRGEGGKCSIPVRNPEWVYLPIHQTYVGFSQLNRAKNYGNAKNQVRYLWNILEKDSIYNARIVTTFTIGNRALDKFNLERTTVNSTETAERAIKKRSVDIVAMKNVRQAVAAQEALSEGDNVVHITAGVFLYRNNPQALDRDFAKLADFLPGTAPYRERNIVPRIWLQSLPYVNEAFLRQPTDRREKYLSRHATAWLNLASTVTSDTKGLEFIALEGGSPVYLDAFDPSQHFRWMAIAQPRSGKSIMTSGYVEMAWLYRQPVVAFDVPRSDGKSTYTDLVNLIKRCGGLAEYYEIGSRSNNLLHQYDFSHLPEVERRVQSQNDLRINGTVTIGMGSINDPALEEAMIDIVTQSLAAFDAQPSIIARFAAANQSLVGTSAWRDSPTYHDYLHFLVNHWLEQYLGDVTLPARYRDASGVLVQKLRTLLHSKLGRAIAHPSDFDNQQDILVFALPGERSDYEMRIMGMAGYAALLGRALTTQVCHFLVDESPQLFPYPGFAQRVGGLATNGAKWGVRLGIISQFPEVVFNSAAGADIKQTLNTVLVGHIEEQIVPTLSTSLGFRTDLLSRCAHPSFKPNGTLLRSHWLVRANGNYTYCGYHPSEVLMALTANDLPEAAARARVMEYYRSDPVRGAIEFSKLYAAARRGRTPMNQIQPVKGIG